MLAGGIKQLQVMFQKLYRGFSDQYMDSPLDCIEGNWEMCGIWREDSDSACARKCINGGTTDKWDTRYLAIAFKKDSGSKRGMVTIVAPETSPQRVTTVKP